MFFVRDITSNWFLARGPRGYVLSRTLERLVFNSRPAAEAALNEAYAYFSGTYAHLDLVVSDLHNPNKLPGGRSSGARAAARYDKVKVDSDD